MEFIGNYKFIVQKEELWNKLNDPQVIKSCIDGCKEFKELEKNHYKTKVNVKLGPVNANFQGLVKIKDIMPINSYTIEASGSAGQLGFAKATVKIKLESEEKYTIIKYIANTEISGKIAQLGSRLIEGSVKKNTEKFFSSLENKITNKTFDPDSSVEKNSNTKKVNRKVWVILFLILLFTTILSLYISK